MLRHIFHTYVTTFLSHYTHIKMMSLGVRWNLKCFGIITSCNIKK